MPQLVRRSQRPTSKPSTRTSISTALWLASTEPTAHNYVRSASNGENNNRGRKGNQGETRDEEVHPHRSARSGARYSGLGFCPARPQQAGQDHRAVPARWRHRHRRTAGGAETVGETWRTVLHREHRRRWRQSRHGPSRALSGRWLHHPVRLFEHRVEPYALILQNLIFGTHRTGIDRSESIFSQY